MDRFQHLFFNEKPDDGHEYIQIHGRQSNERVCKYFRSDWVNHPAPFSKWKVLVPKANGASGKLGDEAARIISKPFVSSPLVANTETYITVGAFDTREEAEACLKYIKSKFARVMLGILKGTQLNTKETWAKVPLQDFSSGSDIDWRASVDAQLYRKYNLTAEEISFIETHVKEMS